MFARPASILRIPRVDRERPRVYLDRNAFSLMWRSTTMGSRDLLRLRRRLCSSRFAARPNILLSQWVFREMSSRLTNPLVERQVAAEFAFIKALPSFLLLKPPTDVMRAEVENALHGGLLDVFFEEGWEFSLDDAPWLEELKALQRLEREDGLAIA